MQPSLARTFVRALAIVVVLLAVGLFAAAMLAGGDISMIFLGLVLAGASMALFEQGYVRKDDR